MNRFGDTGLPRRCSDEPHGFLCINHEIHGKEKLLIGMIVDFNKKESITTFATHLLLYRLQNPLTVVWTEVYASNIFNAPLSFPEVGARAQIINPDVSERHSYALLGMIIVKFLCLSPIGNSPLCILGTLNNSLETIDCHRYSSHSLKGSSCSAVEKAQYAVLDSRLHPVI